MTYEAMSNRENGGVTRRLCTEVYISIKGKLSHCVNDIFPSFGPPLSLPNDVPAHANCSTRDVPLAPRRKSNGVIASIVNVIRTRLTLRFIWGGVRRVMKWDGVEGDEDTLGRRNVTERQVRK